MQILSSRLLLSAALAVFAATTAAGCNTVAGIGKDLGAIGDALTGASEDVQNDGLDGGRSR